MSDVSRPRVQGFLLPDPRLSHTTWTTGASFSQASPYPGVPQPEAATQLVLEASGEQPADTELQIYTVRGGYPGVSDSARYAWRKDDSEDYRGWDVPTAISGYDVVSNASGVHRRGHAITLSTGTILYVCENYNASFQRTGAIAHRRPAGGTWQAASQIAIAQGAYAGSGTPMGPTVCELPDGRVLCFVWSRDDDTDTANVDLWWSDDDGINWTRGARGVLPDTIDIANYGSFGAATTGYDLGRLRCAYLDGEVILLAEIFAHDTSTNQEQIRIFGSVDLGHSFSLVTPADEPFIGFRPEVVAAGSVFVMGYLSATGQPVSITMGSAFGAIIASTVSVSQPTTWGTSGGTSSWSGDMALCVDEDETVYMLGRWDASSQDYHQSAVILRSVDYGASWEAMGASGIGSTYEDHAVWYRRRDSQEPHLIHLTATVQAGRVVVVHQADNATQEDGVYTTQLGGYGSVTLPGLDGRFDLTRQAGWAYTYLPHLIPGSGGFWAVAGAGSDSLDTEGLDVVTTAAQARTYTYTWVANWGVRRAQGLFLIQVDSGASSLKHFRLSYNSPSNAHRFDIELSPTTLTVIDATGTVTIGTISGDFTEPTAILWAVTEDVSGDQDVSVWAGQWTETEDRLFSLGTVSGTLGDAAFDTYGTAPSIVWGHLSTAARQTHWRAFCFNQGSLCGLGLGEGQDNPGGLLGRAYTALPSWVVDGTRIAALDGPTWVGDSSTIATRYEYGIELVEPTVSPSPRVGWRSTDTSEQLIPWALFDGGADTRLLSPVVGLYYAGANWETAQLQGYDGSSWTTVADVDTTHPGIFGPYLRAGNTVRPGAAALGTTYIATDELVGATVDLGGGFLRRVVSNTSGYWRGTSTGTAVRCEIVIEGVTGSEPGGGTIGGAWMTRGLVVVPLDRTIDYRAWRIRIPSQDTVDGYFTLGVRVLGPVLLAGQDPSWTRRRDLEHGTELETYEDGTRTSRNRGPSRRVIQLNWPDGVNLMGVQDGGDGPDYADWIGLSSSLNADPVAYTHDVTEMLDGIFRRTRGPHVPIVYCPVLEYGDGSDVNYVRAAEHLYGRVLTDTITREVIVGDPGYDEVERLTGFVISEEV